MSYNCVQRDSARALPLAALALVRGAHTRPHTPPHACRESSLPSPDAAGAFGLAVSVRGVSTYVNSRVFRTCLLLLLGIAVRKYK